MTTRAERETIIRWDEDEKQAHLYTACGAQAKRWVTQGYEVSVLHWDRHGSPTGWEATAEKDAVRFRRVRDGKVVRRRGHCRGRQFTAVPHDQLVARKAPTGDTHA